MRVLRCIFTLVCAALLAAPGLCEVQLNNLFTDGAVLQRGASVPVWGTARSGEKISVSLQSSHASTVASGGRWMVRLNGHGLKTGGPYTLTVTGDNRIERSVLVGEVWIASGQSNMQLSLAATVNGDKVAAESADPELHLFTVPRLPAGSPLENANGKWEAAGPETTPGFSAVGYYFGRDLRKALRVPVGIIHTSWGGTPAQSWTREKDLRANPSLSYYATDFDKTLADYPAALKAYREAKASYDKAAAGGETKGDAPKPPANPLTTPYRPSSLYNGMIAPLIPYAIRGAIWYQGESNAGKAYEYRTLFPLMIRSWRDAWGEGDFPFYLVQLAPFGPITRGPEDSNWAVLREAQLYTTQTMPNTGMAVITDYGNPVDIHPRDKEPVGHRLALLTLKNVYGRDVVASGPVYDSVRFEGRQAIVRFRDVDGGLMSKEVVLAGTPEAERANNTDKALTGWTVAGPDKVFHMARAEIRGDTVVVSSQEVEHPVAVRYGWANTPIVNLFNKAGLPASPFRTDDFHVATQPAP